MEVWFLLSLLLVGLAEGGRRLVIVPGNTKLALGVLPPT